MKFCVKSRQPYSVLSKADEIRVEYRDREQMFDFIERLENKTYLISIPADTEIDKSFIEAIHEKTDIILELYRINLETLQWCVEKSIKWCWAFPITTFYELRGIAALKPSYVLLGAPLCFSLDKVAKINIPIRLIANEAGYAYLPTSVGLYGPWIRPEAIEKYEKYVSAIDFVSDSLIQEATYLKVYKEQKVFNDNLAILIKHFNINLNSFDFPEDIDEARMTCGQKCMENGICSLCSTGIRLARSVEKLRNSIKDPEK